jgi:hypothetical protein
MTDYIDNISKIVSWLTKKLLFSTIN